jgi:rhomboid protease GluP
MDLIIRHGVGREQTVDPSTLLYMLEHGHLGPDTLLCVPPLTGQEFRPVRELPDLERTLRRLARRQRSREARWRQRIKLLVERYPVVTYALLATNALVFLLLTWAGGSTDPAVLIRFGAQERELVLQGQVWRLLMACFLHLGLWHLALNSYGLYLLGPWMEEVFGRRRTWILYLTSGVVGFAASACFSRSLSAGASGCIFGLLGAGLAFGYRERDRLTGRARQMFGSLLPWALINLLLGRFLNADNYAHLGGLLTGIVLGWSFAHRWASAHQPRWKQVLLSLAAGVLVFLTLLTFGWAARSVLA